MRCCADSPHTTARTETEKRRAGHSHVSSLLCALLCMCIPSLFSSSCACVSSLLCMCILSSSMCVCSLFCMCVLSSSLSSSFYCRPLLCMYVLSLSLFSCVNLSHIVVSPFPCVYVCHLSSLCVCVLSSFLSKQRNNEKKTTKQRHDDTATR
jgi:hypothetical protein